MKRMLVALGFLGFVCAATPAVQTQEAEPGADLKKLDAWIGNWAWEETGKDSPSGEEWKQEGTGEFQRMGESFYVWRNKWKDPNGKDASGVFVFGYDPVEKKMLVHGFTSDGWRGTAVMTIVGETVTSEWTGVTATGEKTRRRCTDVLKEAGPNSCEDFTDGKWWVSSKGTSKKVK